MIGSCYANCVHFNGYFDVPPGASINASSQTQFQLTDGSGITFAPLPFYATRPGTFSFTALPAGQPRRVTFKAKELRFGFCECGTNTCTPNMPVPCRGPDDCKRFCPNPSGQLSCAGSQPATLRVSVTVGSYGIGTFPVGQRRMLCTPSTRGTQCNYFGAAP